MNHKKLRRLCREEGLKVRRREGANEDSARTQSALEPRFSSTRECLALVADTSLPSPRVVRELDAIVAVRGRPAMWVRTTAPRS